MFRASPEHFYFEQNSFLISQDNFNAQAGVPTCQFQRLYFIKFPKIKMKKLSCGFYRRNVDEKQKFETIIRN
jgi:hypothetical protein